MASATQEFRTSDAMSLKIGSTLTFLAGFFAFSVTIYFFVNFYTSLANPAQPWTAGQFTPAPYSLDDVEACNETLADDFVMAQHVEFANVVNGGFLVMAVSWFGLRRSQKWAWFALLFTFVFVGINDTLALLRGGQPLTPVVAESLGLIGLALAWRSVFRSSRNPAG